jgi:signal peptidase I
MPAWVMFVLLGLLTVASLTCNGAAWLWLSGKWLRAPRTRYGRALAAIVMLNFVTIGLAVVNSSASTWAGDRASRQVVMLAVDLAAIVIATTVLAKWALRTSTGKSLLAALVTMFASTVFGLPITLSLRHYVFEAFVVPQGSMAPALIGRHFDVVCSRCGCEFPVSATTRLQKQERLELRNGGMSLSTSSDNQIGVCRNCRFEQPIGHDQPIAQGDRILIEKLGRPQRWDLVVFHFPEEIDVTYIKRLIGMPGETVEIIGGDIFINGQREPKPAHVALEMWVPLSDSTLHRGAGHSFDDPWRPENPKSKWRTLNGTWEFYGSDADSDGLVYSLPLTDEGSYSEQWTDRSSDKINYSVRDVAITCVLQRLSGTGGIGFHWACGDLAARARIAADGNVQLSADGKDQPVRLDRPLLGGEQIQFAFRDGRAMLLVDRREVATIVVGPQDAEACRKPDDPNGESCRLGITADHVILQLSGIAVSRDVHYRSLEEGIFGPNIGHGCLGRPITLNSNEHYVLGDHSARSNDSRFWGSVDKRLGSNWQIGTVPADQMIGIARCIYWPPKRWRQF